MAIIAPVSVSASITWIKSAESVENFILVEASVQNLDTDRKSVRKPKTSVTSWQAAGEVT